jgi:cytochrome c553
MSNLQCVSVVALAALVSGGAQAQSPGSAAAGRLVAQAYCGSCHAVAGGASPLQGAPQFKQLYRHYREGDLEALLAEGMIAPTNPPEEGAAPFLHPRMPITTLGEDQITELKAYLRSLDPRAPSASPQ